MESKACTKCRKVKELSEYCIKSGDKSGYNSQCRQCASLYQKSKRPDKVEFPHPAGTKECSGCKVSKLYASFSRNKACRDGYAGRCKSCERLTQKYRKTKDICYASFYYPINM
jgi:hypothetical protein